MISTGLPKACMSRRPLLANTATSSERNFRHATTAPIAAAHLKDVLGDIQTDGASGSRLDIRVRLGIPFRAFACIGISLTVSVDGSPAPECADPGSQCTTETRAEIIVLSRDGVGTVEIMRQTGKF